MNGFDKCGELSFRMSCASQQTSAFNSVRRPKAIRELKSGETLALRGGGHGHGHGYGHGGGHDHEEVCDESSVREAMEQRNRRIAATERVNTFLQVVTGVCGFGSIAWFLSM